MPASAKVKRNWLRSYIQYTQKQESPELFHFWCGVSAIVGALERSVYLDRGYYAMYPNMYILLVAPSGKCRKSTAVNISASLLRLSSGTDIRTSGDLLTRSGTDIFKEKITPAGIISRLAGKIIIKDGKPQGESKLYIQAPEFTAFISRDAIAQGILTLLTTLYDSPDEWEYGTRTYGVEKLYNVCINFLTASSPDLLSSTVPSDVMGGGFMARVISVAQLDTPRIFAQSKVTEVELDLRDALVRRLMEFRKYKGELELSRRAEEVFDEWYEEKEPPKDERFMSFSAREHDHVLKLSMAMAASRGDLDHSNVINAHRIEEAIRALEMVKSSMHLAFWGIGDHLAARGYERVLEQVKKAGGRAEFGSLLSRNWYHFDKETFKKVMDLLVATRRLDEEIDGGTGRVWYEIRRKK